MKIIEQEMLLLHFPTSNFLSHCPTDINVQLLNPWFAELKEAVLFIGEVKVKETFMLK